MAKKQKERQVDFSQDEMVKKSRMESRNKFTDTFKRICEMYDINPLDFKVDETKEKSGFFFTPECSELLALLIRHLTELINGYVFRYYHHKRPHSSLGGLTPFEKRYL